MTDPYKCGRCGLPVSPGVCAPQPHVFHDRPEQCVLDLVLHVKKLRAALKEVRVERDKLRAVAKAARAWADQEAPEPLEFGDAVIDALVGLKVPGCETSGPKD